MVILIDIFLILNIVVSVFIFVYHGLLAYKLYKMYRTGENGITLYMALERVGLLLVWLWFLAKFIQNFSLLGIETDINILRLGSLIGLFIAQDFILFTQLVLSRKLDYGTG